MFGGDNSYNNLPILCLIDTTSSSVAESNIGEDTIVIIGYVYTFCKNEERPLQRVLFLLEGALKDRPFVTSGKLFIFLT